MLLSTLNHIRSSLQPTPRTRYDHFNTMPSCHSCTCQLQTHVSGTLNHAKRPPILPGPVTTPQETQIKPPADAGECGHSQYPLEGASWASLTIRLPSVQCWSQEPLPRADAFSRMYVNSNGKLFKDKTASLCLHSSHCNAALTLAIQLCARETATVNAISFTVIRFNLPLKTVLHTKHHNIHQGTRCSRCHYPSRMLQLVMPSYASWYQYV